MRGKESEEDVLSLRDRTTARLMGDCGRHHILLGFDGFIDELCRAVDRREGADGFQSFNTISNFAQRLQGSAGLSTAIELQHIQTRAGGNAPNMGEAVLRFGNELSLIASLGKNEIDPVFGNLAASCKKLISLGDPGRTLALEFQDGKIMLNLLGGLEMVSWEFILERVSIEALSRLFEGVSLIGLLDWSINTSQSEVFKRLLRIVTDLEKRPIIFFDLSDLRRRSDREIREVFAIIGEYAAITPTILGLNESESQSIIKALSMVDTDIADRAAAIRKRGDIACVVIHSREGASVATGEGACWVDGPYCPSPLVSTGGGDNFNAGFCNAWLMGMEPDECALTAACTSGYFVTHGVSPNREELLAFMKTFRS